MSRARYDNRSGHQAFFGNEAIQYNKDMQLKYYGQQEGCPTWQQVITGGGVEAEKMNRLKTFAKKTAGARTITISDGSGEGLANTPVNIGGREYMTDGTGNIRMLSQDCLQDKITRITERQQYLNETAKANFL